MHTLRFAAAAAALLMTTATSFALESNVTMTSKLSPDALWAKIGGFCDIAKWLPGIEKCTLSADGKQRTLAAQGGGAAVEQIEAWDNAGHSYTYTIVGGNLPVANYHSTISVAADPNGSALHWVGAYEAKGAPDADAKKLIDGIYEAGAKSLVSE